MRAHSDLGAQRIRSAWIFLAPTLIVLAIVAGWPLLRTVYFSLTNASLTNLAGAEFVGFKNYFSWVTLKSGRTVYSGLLTDMAWWRAVWNTIRFTLLSVSLETIFGLVVALVLNANFRGRGLVRAAILIPWGDPDHRFGKNVGLDAQRPVRHPEPYPAQSWHHQPQDCMDRQSGHCNDRNPDCRRLENDTLYGAAHPGGSANGAVRYL
ncbi:binding-protein-dependent transport system inner membrane component [Brucella melitensis]